MTLGIAHVRCHVAVQSTPHYGSIAKINGDQKDFRTSSVASGVLICLIKSIDDEQPRLLEPLDQTLKERNV